MSAAHSAGTSVIASTVEPAIANVLVNASGWNNLPSCPVSEKTGMNARMMMTIAKKIGRPTCRAATSVTSMISAPLSRRPFSFSAVSAWRMTFSVITMPASTSTPMAMAMPERDMMFDEMPKWFIKMNAIRMESGSGSTTMKMLRK